MITAAGPRGGGAPSPVIERTPPSPRPPEADAPFPLGLLSAGEGGEIVSLGPAPGSSGGCRTEELGLRVGKTLEMLANGGGGAVLLRVGEARLAVDRRVAMKILVRRTR